MLPDLESLHCFESAARTLNFRAAAQIVALSPPAFSDRIRRLEDDLGAELFHRTTRSVHLTAAGERLLPEARAILAAATRLQEVVHSDRKLPFDLHVGTRFELGLSWLLPALRSLESERAERTVHLSFGDSPALLERTLSGTLDATVTSARLNSAKLDAAKLHEEFYVFVSAPIAKKKKRTSSVEEKTLRPSSLLSAPKDAPKHMLIDAAADLPLFRYFADAGPTSEDWRFGRTLLIGSIAGIRTRVLAGDGVAVLPRYLVQQDLDDKRLVTLFPERSLQRDFFRLVFRAGHPREIQLRALAEDLRRHPLQ